MKDEYAKLSPYESTISEEKEDYIGEDLGSSREKILYEDLDEIGVDQDEQPQEEAVAAPADILEEGIVDWQPETFNIRTQAVRETIELFKERLRLRRELTEESITRLERDIEEDRQRLKQAEGWIVTEGKVSADNRATQIETRISNLRGRIEDRKVQEWKDTIPIKEKLIQAAAELQKLESFNRMMRSHAAD